MAKCFSGFSFPFLVLLLSHGDALVARAILHVQHHQMHITDVVATIGWQTLAWRRRCQKLSLLWDLLHGGGPPSLRSQVPSPVSSRRAYSFRNPWSLSLPSCRTSRRPKSFLPSSVALFNSLPISVELMHMIPSIPGDSPSATHLLKR